MKVEQFKCDVCGKVRGEGNHWIRAYWSGDGNNLIFKPWAADGGNNGDRHLCGEGCASKALGSWFEGIRKANDQ